MTAKSRLARFPLFTTSTLCATLQVQTSHRRGRWTVIKVYEDGTPEVPWWSARWSWQFWCLAARAAATRAQATRRAGR